VPFDLDGSFTGQGNPVTTTLPFVQSPTEGASARLRANGIGLLSKKTRFAHHRNMYLYLAWRQSDGIQLIPKSPTVPSSPCPASHLTAGRVNLRQRNAAQRPPDARS